MSEPPTEYQVGDIANGYIWTGVEWTRYYVVGDVENGYMWTGDAWVVAEDGPVVSAPDEVVDTTETNLAQTDDPPAETDGDQSQELTATAEPTGGELTPISAPAVVGAAVAQGLPTATSSDFFTDEALASADLSFLDVPDEAATSESPIYKRWWFWAVAGACALLAVGAFALSNRNGEDPLPNPSNSPSSTLPTASTSGNPTPSNSGSPDSSPTPSGSSSLSPSASPSGTGIAQITSRYGTFAPVKAAGTGAGVVNLPTGSEYGMVTVVSSGPGVFAITGLAADNTPTGDLLVDTSGPYSGTTAYGLVSVGAKAAKLKIDASGPWKITIAPLDKAPTLTFPAKGTTNAVYIYLGAVANWKIVHTSKASSNFSVVQYGQLPNLLVNAIGNYTGTVPVTAGPTVVTIDASGPWAITPAP